MAHITLFPFCSQFDSPVLGLIYLYIPIFHGSEELMSMSGPRLTSRKLGHGCPLTHRLSEREPKTKP